MLVKKPLHPEERGVSVTRTQFRIFSRDASFLGMAVFFGMMYLIWVGMTKGRHDGSFF
jgi:hypothetical protein